MKPISRRKFLKLTGATCLGGMVGASFFSPQSYAADENVLVLSEWGGEFQDALREAYFKPFTQKTGIKVIEETWGGTGLAKLKAQQQANNVEIDLIGGPHLWAPLGKKQGILEKIDPKYIDTSNIMKGAVMDYGFGYAIASWGITFNEKTFSGKQPRNWADFWDVKSFPGPRTMFGPVIFRHPEYALMADGVAPENVYPLDAKKIDQAFRKLDELKPHITTWYTTGGQCQQLLADEEVVLAEFFNGRTFALAQKGVPIKFEFDQAVYNYTTWVLAKNAPHKENALKFLGFISQPEVQANLAKLTTYGPVNTKALELIKDETILRNLPSSPENIKNQIELDAEWWAENIGAYAARWNTWLSQ